MESPPFVDSELPSSIQALTALSSSWNIVQQLKIFLAHFLQADLDSSLAALQIPIPTFLSKSDNTILPAVDFFFPSTLDFLLPCITAQPQLVEFHHKDNIFYFFSERHLNIAV